MRMLDELSQLSLICLARITGPRHVTRGSMERPKRQRRSTVKEEYLEDWDSGIEEDDDEEEELEMKRRKDLVLPCGALDTDRRSCSSVCRQGEGLGPQEEEEA
jgi:hypothetical protein